MRKTISLVIISSFLLISNAHAIYEEELLGLIREHIKPTNPPKVLEPASGVVAYVTSLPSKVAESAGEGVRRFGDSMRGEDGVLKHVGNGLRTLGEYGSAEPQTLERKLRAFWIDAKISQQANEKIFVSTAYALCASKELTEDLSVEDGVSKIHSAYQDFITSWNNSSLTTPYHTEDKSLHITWFLDGIIRKRAYEGRAWETTQDVLTTVSLYRIDLTLLPKTKGITEETVFKDNLAAKPMDPEARFAAIQAKRLEELLNYIKIQYQYERSLLRYKDE